jgi:hypothetical protein
MEIARAAQAAADSIIMSKSVKLIFDMRATANGAKHPRRRFFARSFGTGRVLEKSMSVRAKERVKIKLEPEYPDRHNDTERGQPADGPAGGIGGIVIAVATDLVKSNDRASPKIRHGRLLIFTS